MSPTRHFQARACERGLRFEVAQFIVQWGAMIEARDGVTYFTIMASDLPPDVDDEMVRRARGWILVSRNGYILTCYRANGWRTLKRRRDVRGRVAA